MRPPILEALGGVTRSTLAIVILALVVSPTPLAPIETVQAP